MKLETHATHLPRHRRLGLHYGLATAIVGCALTLRVPTMAQSLWLDELHTAWTISGGLGELWHRAAMGNTSGVYFLLPWATTRLLGMSELALRLPSLVAGLSLVVVLFIVVRRWTGSLIGASLASALAAIDPQCQFFSTEARAYAIVQLIALLQLWAFWELTRHHSWTDPPRKHWPLRATFIALSVLLFYLHYTAILILGAELVYLFSIAAIPALRSSCRSTALFLDTAIVAALCAPALPHLWEIAQRRKNWGLFVPVPGHLQDNFHLFYADLYAGVPAVLLGLILLFRWRSELRPRWRVARHGSQIWLAVCCLFVPVLVAFALTRLDVARLWMARYVIVSSIAPMLIGGLACGVLRSGIWRFVVAIVTMAAAIYFLIPFWPWTISDGRMVIQEKENWRDAVAMVQSDRIARDWPVLVHSGLIEADGLVDSDDPNLREYCLLPVHSIYNLSGNRLMIPLPSPDPGKLQEDDLAALEDSPGIWLITRGNLKYANNAAKHVQHALKRHGMQPGQQEVKSFGRVCVVRISFRK